MIRVSSAVFVSLLLCAIIAVLKASSGDSLVRRRREWILPPKPLRENKDYTQREYIAKIRSDYETKANIIYSLEGVGANQYPFHVFVVNEKTGLIRVTKVLDRELVDTYHLSGVARYTDGSVAEKNIDLRIKVVDENDNPPVFSVMTPGEVDELSPADTLVMKIIATDADEPGNDNSKIAYSIIDQSPDDDMFYMKPDGTIYVKKPVLDREKVDKYVLTVKGQDLNGNPGGNSATSTVTINIRDVNDNLPTLEKDEYEAIIVENTVGVEVMRIKALDLDLKGTANWEAMFVIIKGNEAGYFSIRTDPKTNEGIVMLVKAVDYENVNSLELQLAVQNKAAAYSGIVIPSNLGTSSAKYNVYPIKINVKDQPEGPHFEPKVKAIPISEGGHSFSIGHVIGIYPALDGDTGKPAENVRYAIGSGPGNWLIIDPETAEIKLNKMPDRESPLLVNGTYYTEVLCITKDLPAKTATGTIAIQVEDFNDHCPTLTNNIQTMCTIHDSIIVTAKDEDAFPNGPPFHFDIVPEGTEGKWQVEHLNDTAAILRSQESLWPGVYEVEFLVKDGQGEACPNPQKVKVHVCTCENGVVCGKLGGNGKPSKGAELGPAGIGLLLLGLLLLLLIPLLLLFCQCGSAGLPGGFTEMPFDTKSHLINYHTEGQGENTAVPLLNLPTQLDASAFKSSMGMVNPVSAGMPNTVSAGMANTVSAGMANTVSAGMANNVSSGANNRLSMDMINGAAYEESSGFQTWGEQWGSSAAYLGFEGREAGVAGGGIYDGMALPDHFLGQYYTQASCGNENLGVKDALLIYDYEGQGSSAGSIGCCSLLESDNDLQFLDDLGLKFKTLAEVCGGKKISTEVKQELTSLPSAAIKTQTSVSSLTTQQLPPAPKLPLTVPRTEQTVVRETSQHSQMVNENMATLRKGMITQKQEMATQGQMLLLQQQQPVYYTTTPVLQQVQCVVQPQVQNTMLLTEAPATNLQGMVLVNGIQTGPTQGMVVQGQPVMSIGQAQGPGMVLVEKSGVHGSVANLIHAGNLSGTQTMMVVEGKVPAGSMQAPMNCQTRIVQGGTLQSGGLSGSQRVMVVGGATSSRGQLVHEAGDLSQSGVFGSQRVLYSQDSISTGSQSSAVSPSATTVSITPTYHKVVVQETREIH
ncbi:hypothetical protein PAMA_001872 [Pampus argenteus]